MGPLLRRLAPRAVGLMLVALFLWFGGPYFAFADFRPLESPTVRLLLIAVIVGAWLARQITGRLRAVRAGEKFFAGLVKQDTAAARPSAEAQQLRERFEEAVASLKEDGSARQTLYELPWFVFIGAPGSGKTTALVNSGLRFIQRSHASAIRGVGGTRNCDWWFTSQAVFLDTAGRYTSQDSDAVSDSSGWAEFLALLRKYRPLRPINGVILVTSVEELITLSPSAREAHASAARRRLAELVTQLQIDLPVYVMVTKCDLLAGFAEFFDHLAQAERAQVWGMTFPYELTIDGRAAGQFRDEFDTLIGRLDERLFARIQDEPDVQLRTRIFAFPEQVAAIRDALDQFIDDVFAPARAAPRPMLRGVYLTSGTQEGTPIDRLLAAAGRQLAVRSDAVIGSTGRGKAYFIGRFLKEVLIPESGLAGVNRGLELKQAGRKLAAYAAIGLVALAGIVLLSVSYRRNLAYVTQVAADVDALRHLPPLPPAATLDALLPRLDALRVVSDEANRYRGDIPWSMRFGLYRGTPIGNAALDAYVRELDEALLPRMAAVFRQRLHDYATEPEKLYEYLKAYLMLGQPEHLDKAHLLFLADLEWRATSAGDPDRAASAALHFRRLLDREPLRPMALDPVLVAQARSTIQQASVPWLIYSRLRLNYADNAARALRLDVSAGPAASRVLRRKSGASLSEPVPGLFTAAVFKEVTGSGMSDLIKQFTADYWVWGDARPSLKDSAQLASEVIDVYEHDYIAQWDALLSDVELASFTDAADALATLAGPTSPLRALLQTVDANTFIVKPPEPDSGGALSSAQQALGKLFSKGKEAVGLPAVAPGTQITTHFEPIHALVAGAPGAAPIDRVLGLIGQIGKQLLTVGAGAGQTRSLDAVENLQLGADLRSLQQEAATLPPQVHDVVAQVAARTSGVVISGATSELENRYRQEVLRECNAVVAGRYPFTPGSAVDVGLEDFGRLFGYDGVFDGFFKANLQKLVDTSRAPWVWRPGSVGLSPAMLRPFEAAEHVREVFFSPASKRPEVHFTVMLTDVDAQATAFVVEIDGQRFENRHDPERARPGVWPGPNPGTSAVTFEDRSGSRPYKDFSGAWAAFRLFSFGQPQAESDVRSALRVSLGGHTAKVHVEAPSIHNPFVGGEWQRFRCEY